MLPDMAGKGNRVRTVTVPAGVKTRIDAWLAASGITGDRLFRPVSKAGELAGAEIRDEKAVWRLVMRYAKASDLGKLAPHDLRRTCAKLCRKAGGDLEQIQLLLGHASIQTTERYLGDGAGPGSCGERRNRPRYELTYSNSCSHSENSCAHYENN